MYKLFWWENMKESDHLGGLDVDGSAVELTFKEMCLYCDHVVYIQMSCYRDR